MNDDLDRAAALISQGRVLVLTGAGISVDSGIPDFRSPGGLWERFPIETYGTIDGFLDDPARSWRLFAEIARTLAPALPNAGHRALAALEAAGLVSGVVTQNIDGLHQAAGSRDVIEFHGACTRLACVHCGIREPAPLDRMATGGEAPPQCSCGAVQKPDVVLFGEAIPPGALQRSRALAQEARVCLVCGTSAQVAPASYIPAWAADAGARIIEVNLERTGLTAALTDVFLEGSTSAVLPELARRAGRITRPDSVR